MSKTEQGERPTGSPPTPSRTRNYLVGLLTGYTVVGLAVVVNLWLTPFTLRFLNREEYALFVFSSDILLWLNLLDFGMTAGLRLQIAQFTGRPDRELMNRLASTTFFSQLVISVFILAAGVALAVTAPRFFQISPELHTRAVQVLLLLTLGTLVAFITRTFSALLIAHQQTHVDNLIRMATLLLRTALAVFLLFRGWNVLSLAVASVAASAGIALLTVIRCYRVVPTLSINYRLASAEMLWTKFKNLNFWFGIANIAGLIILYLDRIIAARIVSLESVTTLTLTGRVYDLAGLLLLQLTTTAQPGIGQLLGMGDRDTAFTTYRHLFLISAGGAIVAALSLWAGNVTFVVRWVGVANYGGTKLDIALALALMVNAWILPSRAVLAGALMARPLALTRIVEAVVNLSLAVWLSMRFGLVGIAISTAIAGAVTSCWYLPRLVAKYFGRGYWEMLWQIASPLIVPFAVLLPIAWAMRRFAAVRGGYVPVVIAVAVVGGIGLLLLWWLAFDAPMRAKLRGIAAQMRAPSP